MTDSLVNELNEVQIVEDMEDGQFVTCLNKIFARPSKDLS